MSIIISCDRCKHQEGMKTLLNIPPQNMHSVCPGNLAANDRVLCDACIKEYRQIQVDTTEEATKKLLHWIDCRES